MIMVPNLWTWTACIASVCMIISPVSEATFASGIVPSKCVQCLCTIESRCRNNPCFYGPGPTTCGYFGITEDYYNACGRPGKGWKECAADQFCSSFCIQNYVSLYIGQCEERNCLSYARLHHGGPHGCYNPNTMEYALWVQNCFTKA